MEEAGKLQTYINFGLNSDSAESLENIVEEVGLTSSIILNTPLGSEMYSLATYQQNLEGLLAFDGVVFSSPDCWFLEHFEQQEATGVWQFWVRPAASQTNMFHSDNEDSFDPHDGDHDDDD